MAYNTDVDKDVYHQRNKKVALPYMMEPSIVPDQRSTAQHSQMLKTVHAYHHHTATRLTLWVAGSSGRKVGLWVAAHDDMVPSGVLVQ